MASYPVDSSTTKARLPLGMFQTFQSFKSFKSIPEIFNGLNVLNGLNYLNPRTRSAFQSR